MAGCGSSRRWPATGSAPDCAHSSVWLSSAPPVRRHADPVSSVGGSSSVGRGICGHKALLAALISHQFHGTERTETTGAIGGGHFEHQALLFEQVAVDGLQGKRRVPDMDRLRTGTIDFDDAEALARLEKL